MTSRFGNDQISFVSKWGRFWLTAPRGSKRSTHPKREEHKPISKMTGLANFMEAQGVILLDVK